MYEVNFSKNTKKSHSNIGSVIYAFNMQEVNDNTTATVGKETAWIYKITQG